MSKLKRHFCLWESFDLKTQTNKNKKGYKDGAEIISLDSRMQLFSLTFMVNMHPHDPLLIH